MAVIYYYAKKDSSNVFLKYGIRLSKNFDRELNLNGYKKPYLIGYLNPKDNLLRYDSDDYVCIKLEVSENHALVVDYEALNDSDIISSYIALDNYTFGSLKFPRVLIDSSIMSDKISFYDKNIDVPLLYDNSEDFYYEVQVQKRLDEMSAKEAFLKLTT